MPRPPRKLPLGPTPNELRSEIAPDPAHDPLAYIRITLQNGPIGEVGVNGAQIDDVIRWCQSRLVEFNDTQPSMHNVEAIRHLGFALRQLALRTTDRIRREVEGTSAP